jgi:hypothetical protein
MTLKERADETATAINELVGRHGPISTPGDLYVLLDAVSVVVEARMEAVVREAAEVINKVDGDPDLVILRHFGLTDIPPSPQDAR